MQRNLYSTCFQKAPLESGRACTMHKSEGDQQGLECVLELSTRGPAAIPLQFDSLSSSRAQYMRFSHRTEVHAAWSVNLSLSCILYFCNLYFCIWVILHFVFWQSRTSARQIFPRKMSVTRRALWLFSSSPKVQLCTKQSRDGSPFNFFESWILARNLLLCTLQYIFHILCYCWCRISK